MSDFKRLTDAERRECMLIGMDKGPRIEVPAVLWDRARALLVVLAKRELAVEDSLPELWTIADAMQRELFKTFGSKAGG